MSDREELRPLRVPDELLDYDEESIYTYEGERFTGIGYADVPGHGLSEISYVDGVQDGPARDWYVSGQLRYEANYKRNVRHGSTRQFREDGSLVSESVYDDGLLVRSVTVDADGNVVDHYENLGSSPNSPQLRQFLE